MGSGWLGLVPNSRFSRENARKMKSMIQQIWELGYESGGQFGVLGGDLFIDLTREDELKKWG